MKKRILIGLPLGCLSSVLGSIFGIPLLIIILCVSAASAAASKLGGPYSSTGSGKSSNAATVTPQTQHSTGNTNDAVINAARDLVQFLYACGEDGHYKCYTSGFPKNVLQYLNDACGNPECPYAQSGNFQCVFFVLGAYYMAGQPLPMGPDAVKFWAAYQNVSGWLEVPANAEPRAGDLAVFSGPSGGPYPNPLGHIAIIIAVNEPLNDGTTGSIELAQSNGLHAVEDLSLIKVSQDHPIFQVQAWNGYQLLGYIRNAAHG
jgi:CHAP domain